MIEELTIIFVSFHSEKKIIEYLNSLKNKYKIIIIDNANDQLLGRKLATYQNIEIVTNEKNLGFGAAANQALKRVKTKYALHLDIDSKIEILSIDKMIEESEKIQDFAITAPEILNHNYKKENFIKKNYKENYNLMNFVEGCCLFFNVKEIKDIGFFDEKFFLYFEEVDLVKRLINQKRKVILINNIFIEHEGRASVDVKYNEAIEINRNWHYMWSKFYYHKKHYGYFYAILKVFKSFLSAGLKSIIYSFSANTNKKKIYQARFSGCLNSILLKKSWYRPKL